MTRLPVHVDIEGYDVADNCLVVGGRKLTDWVAKSGGTPLYLYDCAIVERQINALRAHLPRHVHIHYAIKANPLPALVSFIADRVDGLDVASAGELEVALSTSTAPHDISFAGPGKRDEELARAVDAGVTVNVESANELRRLNAVASSRHTSVDVAIRVNPDFELKSSGMKMSGGPKPFGIDAEQVPSVLRELRELKHVRFRGFHIFSGSQNLDAGAISDAQKKSVELALSLHEHAPCKPNLVNIGGGFGIPYFPGDRPLDIAAIGTALPGILEPLTSRIPDVEIVIELGRYIVGSAGIFVCSVIDKKVSRGMTFLVADGGLNNHLSASGNFGQVLRKNYPVIVGNRVASATLQQATVVGPLCTPLDVLANNMPLGHAEMGDLIVILQSGAYGASASPEKFLSHPPSREVLMPSTRW